ncbi:hypothetical protein HYH02_006322 [Chlamydomonas schloesseri]|uniref:Uncharacterized protein n=1 Tax=Chlamydomonas schloesseri TaxID=2026947 RepID=A0A836B5V5_9CHLO|nr:hypothetical protein HYH02_006322 [Chlamydomonas schloesseri]|eukprot:KAG2448430.1 hypothetical protein HYH02_006322 [Chlamydomonas schloesseri]
MVTWWCNDNLQGFNATTDSFLPAGPDIAGWRWRYGTDGTADLYSPFKHPELTVHGNEGINATYQLIFETAWRCLAATEAGGGSPPGGDEPPTLPPLEAHQPPLLPLQHPATAQPPSPAAELGGTGTARGVVCSVVLRGGGSMRAAGVEAALLTDARLRCTRADNSGNNSSDPDPVQVEVGPILARFFESHSSAASGVTLVTAVQHERPHWGVAFMGLASVTLKDVVLEGLPLSTAAPLVECRGCGSLTLDGLRISGLQPPAADGGGGELYGGGSGGTAMASGGPLQQEPPGDTGRAVGDATQQAPFAAAAADAGSPGVHGAIAASGLAWAAVRNTQCSNVTGATWFACLSLEFGSATPSGVTEAYAASGTLTIERSSFIGNTVVGDVAEDAPSLEANGLPVTGAVSVNSTQAGALRSVVIRDSAFEGNTGRVGAAIRIETAMPLLDLFVASNTSVSGNTAGVKDWLACALSLVQRGATNGTLGRVVLEQGSRVDDNVATHGRGAGLCVGAGVRSLELRSGSSISRNTAPMSTGIFIAGEAENITFADSRADENAGDCAVLEQWGEKRGCNLLVSNSSVSRNRAEYGAGFCGGLFATVAIVKGSRVEQQRSIYGGTVLYMQSDQALQLLVVDGDGTCVCDNAVTPVDDTWHWGTCFDILGGIGAIVMSGGARISSNVGAYSGVVSTPFTGSITLSRATINHNRATQMGAGVFSIYNPDLPLPRFEVLDGSILENNTTPQNGGVLLAGSLGLLRVDGRSAIVNNQAPQGLGGAFALTAATTDSSSEDSSGDLLAGRVALIEISGGSYVTGNQAKAGGFAYVPSGTGDIKISGGAAVESNWATDQSGGFLCADSVKGTVSVRGNGTRLCKNAAIENGGAVYGAKGIFGGVHVLEGATVCGNFGSEGGALWGQTVGPVSISGPGSSLVDNMARRDGGAVWSSILWEAEVSDGGVVARNRARSGDGGAFRADYVGSMAVTSGATISRCTAGADGGFVAAARIRHLRLSGATVTGCQAGDSGGFAAMQTLPKTMVVEGGTTVDGCTAEAGTGGVFSIKAPTTDSLLLDRVREDVASGAPTAAVTVRVQDSRFIGCSAELGGGVLAVAAAPVFGAAAVRPVSDRIPLNLSIAASSFSGCASTSGPGGAVSLSAPASGAVTLSASVTASSFDSCSAAWGGAVSISCQPVESSSVASAGGQQAVVGGGAAAAAAGLIVQDSAFSRCVCRGGGGAALAAGSCPVYVRRSNFSSNLAEGGSGASIWSRFLQEPAAVWHSGNQQQQGGMMLEVTDSHFRNETARAGCGGSIYAETAAAASVRLTRSIWSGCTAASGGGLCLVARSGGAQATVTGCSFDACRASGGLADGSGGGAVLASLSAGPNSTVAVGDTQITRCRATACIGGAALADVAPGSGLTLLRVNASDNSATHAGAVAARCASSRGGSGTTCGEAPLLRVIESRLTSNQAAGLGGALLVPYGASALALRSVLEGNAAAAGGAVGALGCDSLSVINSSLAGGTATALGGGLAARACRRVFVSGSSVRSNSAPTGAGLLLAGGITNAGDAELLSQSSLDIAVVLSASPALAQTYSALVLASSISSNTAGASANGTTAAASSTAVAGYRRYGSHGGGLFVMGDTSVALAGCDLARGNRAFVGSAVASTQRCSAGAAASNQSLLMLGAKHDEQWAALESAARGGCALLALSDTALPAPPSSAAAAAEPAAQQATSQMQHDNTGAGTDGASSVSVWMQDTASSALRVRCGTGEQAARESDGCTTASAGVGTTGQRRACQLANQLAACAALYAGGVAGGARSGAGALLVVPPTHMVLTEPAAAGDEQLTAERDTTTNALVAAPEALSRVLRWRPGQALNLSIALTTALGQPADKDLLPYNVALSVQPLLETAASGARFQSPPWAGMPVAALDPGFSSGRSLTVPVTRGVARWPDVLVHGWPGRYVLTFAATAQVDSALYPITPLHVELELLPCDQGETLDTGMTSQPGALPTWLSCTACDVKAVGLWRDSRPLLQSLTNLTAPAFLHEISQLAQSTLRDEGACLACPEDANCEGGPVLVPKQGYWHSAPDSALFHECPQASACGDGSAMGHWEELMEGVGVQHANTPDQQQPADDLDARSAWLARCQEDGYALLSQLQARTGLQSANLSLQELQDAAVAAYGLGDISSSTTGGPVCRMFGLAADNNASYMQQQCAPGYTGTLCAACQARYFINSEWECKRCPPLARTIGLAIVAFLASVALVLYTTFTNAKENFGEDDEDAETLPSKTEDAAEEAASPRGPGAVPSSRLAAAVATTGQRAATDEEETGVADIVKLLIVHFQYFIIICRLQIPYPDSITSWQGVISSLTGTESVVAYSTSCLVPSAASGGQAAMQLLGALFIPCTAIAVAMMLWAVRVQAIVAVAHDSQLAAGAGAGAAAGTAAGNSATSLVPRSPSSLAPAVRALSAKVGTMVRQLSLKIHGGRTSLFQRMDAALSLGKQLAVLLLIAVFIMYPGWANASLSIFACYIVDDGAGSYADRQKATAPWGYWIRDMNTACYAGTHMAVWVPVGAVCTIVFCFCPPTTSLALMITHRKRLHEPAVEQRYGFLYKRYKPHRYWWEAVLQMQELSLVAVEVFARALDTAQQALLMLVAFMLIATINSTFAPLRTRLMGLLEFISLSTLCLTVALSLYFIVSTDLGPGAADVVGALIVAINVGLFLGFVIVIVRKSLPKVKGKIERVLSQSSLRRRSSVVAREESKLLGSLVGVRATAGSGSGAGPSPLRSRYLSRHAHLTQAAEGASAKGRGSTERPWGATTAAQQQQQQQQQAAADIQTEAASLPDVEIFIAGADDG